jgi:hypothetical protein
MFEYPWAYTQLVSRLQRGTIVEVGGSLSGLQFVLAKRGFDMINVDPGLQARGKGWFVTPESHEYLGRVFGAPVRLMPVTLDQAPLADESVDALLSISTLEHFVPQDLSLAARTISRILKPNGWAILTIDLFLDVAPFAAATTNKWGTNIDVKAFLDEAGLQLVEGDRHQLHGYPEFSPDEISRRRADFIAGTYPALAQCVVARKIATT